MSMRVQYLIVANITMKQIVLKTRSALPARSSPAYKIPAHSILGLRSLSACFKSKATGMQAASELTLNVNGLISQLVSVARWILPPKTDCRARGSQEQDTSLASEAARLA